MAIPGVPGVYVPPFWVTRDQPVGAVGTPSYEAAAALSAAADATDVFTASELEAISDLRPAEIAYLLDTLNGLPAKYRFKFILQLQENPAANMVSLAYGLMIQNAERIERQANYWKFDWSFSGSGFYGTLANLGGFALGVGLGGLVGYGATALGVVAGNAVGSIWIGTLVQIAVTAGTAYGSAYLGEQILTDFGNKPMSEFGQWLMTGAYAGGIIGGAAYVYGQIPSVDFGVGYNPSWFEQLSRDVSSAAFRVQNYVVGTGIPIPPATNAAPIDWWLYWTSK